MEIKVTYFDVATQTGSLLIKNFTIPVPNPKDVYCQIIDLRTRGHQISTPKKEIFLFPSAILKAEIIKE